jgi:DNA ligase (NAD+)
VVGRSIHTFFQEGANREMIARLLERGVKPATEPRTTKPDSTIKGTTWVLTGTLSQPRDEIAEILISRGGKVSASVSKKTSFVLAGEDAGSKLDKAKQMGIRVLTEADFRKML